MLTKTLLVKLGWMLHQAKSRSEVDISATAHLVIPTEICEKHTCRCGKLVEENGHHGLSCARSAGRFSMHHNLNIFAKQALRSIKVPTILEYMVSHEQTENAQIELP